MLENPRQLVARFESGEIDRTEFQTLMAVHARELIGEIQEDHQNPFAAWLEARRCKAAVKHLLKKHHAHQIREILTALAEDPTFPMAKYLWNAPHPDVPLHCFFRITKEPIFQILSITTQGRDFRILIEILNPENRQAITLTRDQTWKLHAPPFSKGEAPE